MSKKLIFSSALALGCSGTLPDVASEVSRRAPERATTEPAGQVVAAALPSEAPVTLFQARSEFNRITIQGEDDRRDLLFEPSLAIQSSVRLSQPLDLQLAYTRAAMVALAAHPNPTRVLVVGLGGGAMPMFLRAIAPKLSIHVVELDSLVVQVARAWMGFREDERMVVYVGDGRRFIEKSDQRYDIIFLDAYGPSDIPVSLTTVQFLRSVCARLSADGLVAGNVWSPTFNELYDSMLRSYQEAFGERMCVLDAEDSGNRIFLARGDGAAFDWPDVARRAQALTKEKALPFDLGALAAPGCKQVLDIEAKPLWDE
ncbi:MAG: fused MFS/spermidine synthase [Myxococcales bacterium]|jgi:spermidine synthase|nr:fused MFS/spermidine synthase [Myxococcales bacterium]